jgi:hypothetical protein
VAERFVQSVKHECLDHFVVFVVIGIGTGNTIGFRKGSAGGVG